MAVISANLGILNRKLHVPPSSLFMIVLTISDILTLNFFYLVRDEGSWLDIGTSISHFCISNLLILFIIALEQLSEVLKSLKRIENRLSSAEQWSQHLHTIQNGSKTLELLMEICFES
jgi:Phosphatidylinositolglycan class N (PIG-N)